MTMFIFIKDYHSFSVYERSNSITEYESVQKGMTRKLTISVCNFIQCCIRYVFDNDNFVYQSKIKYFFVNFLIIQTFMYGQVANFLIHETVLFFF